MVDIVVIANMKSIVRLITPYVEAIAELRPFLHAELNRMNPKEMFFEALNVDYNDRQYEIRGRPINSTVDDYEELIRLFKLHVNVGKDLEAGRRKWDVSVLHAKGYVSKDEHNVLGRIGFYVNIAGIVVVLIDEFRFYLTDGKR